MRSSVSAILSSPTQDPNMSHPDYEMTVYDHGTLLILVKHLGKYHMYFYTDLSLFLKFFHFLKVKNYHQKISIVYLNVFVGSTNYV